VVLDSLCKGGISARDTEKEGTRGWGGKRAKEKNIWGALKIGEKPRNRLGEEETS